jgi:hypothetical protein
MRPIPVYIALVVALLLPAAALAQDRTARRAPPVHPEEVIVTQSASGEQLRGYLVQLSPTTLAILVDGKRVEVPIENVLRIDGQNDSVKNGAAIGAVVAGGLTALACGPALGSSGICVTSTLFYTGIGALMGAGVDVLHKGRTTIYSKPAAVAIAVAPAGKGARAQLAIRW